MRVVHIYIAILLAFLPVWMSAQIVLQPKTVAYDVKGLIYSTEEVFELRPHVHGFVLGYKKGKLKSYYETSYMGYEVGYMVDSRQKSRNKQEARIADTPRESFYYGKRSSLLNLRVTFGQKRYLSEKTKRKGVAMGYIYEGGATVGLIKPYYLRVVRVDENLINREVETIKYSEETHDDFLNYDNIYGGTSYAKGLSEVTPTVGLHGKIAMHWAIGAFERRVKAVEAGLMLDVYPRKIPFVVERENISNDFIFLKLYLSAQFGRRRL